MPSARSKKLDQLYVSKAEVKKNKQVSNLKALVKYSHSTFQGCCVEDLGLRFWKRLVKTAKRAKMTPLHYAEKKLLK